MFAMNHRNRESLVEECNMYLFICLPCREWLGSEIHTRTRRTKEVVVTQYNEGCLRKNT